MTSRNPLIDALQNAQAYPHPTDRIELVETHISWVLLTGDFAYKIKRPVKLPFVDFSTPELRKRYCDDELRLNRRLAPELYLDVVPIGGTPEAPRVGATPAIEHAVKMVQFPRAQTLDERLDRQEIPLAAVHELAERLAEFHGGLEPTAGAAADRAALENLGELEADLEPPARRRLEPIAAWLRQQTAALGNALRQREADGAIRECHGDLHLGNLAWIEDRIVPFDCLEFDAKLRTIDTLDEIAFLVMDFMARGHGDLGFELLNRYLEVSGDYAGLGLLRYYLVHRALVRSKVRALVGAQDDGRRGEPRPTPYLDLAARLVGAQTPVLVITHGLSGSGKTTVTTGLVGRLPAIRVRSDLERKRLHGFRPGERSGSGTGGGIYTASASDATYAALAAAAGTALGAGLNVIVDAAFLEQKRRRAFAELAEREGAGFAVIDCGASGAELRERVAKRHASGSDASEAGLAVLEHQLEHSEPIGDDEPGQVISIDTGAQRLEEARTARTYGGQTDSMLDEAAKRLRELMQDVEGANGGRK